jgi:hypothetical protein
MKSALTFFTISLLLTGCNSGDTKLRQQIAGTWINSVSNCTVTIFSNGSFVTRYTFVKTNVTSELIYQGKWQIKNGVMISTTTNVSGPEPRETVGTTDNSKIIRLNDRELIFDGLQKAFLTRKR